MKARSWYLVRFARCDGAPLPSGGRWIGVLVQDTDPLNALIQARRANRELRDCYVLDVLLTDKPSSPE